MEKVCGKCLAGPSGISGHEALRVATIGAGMMRFQCMECTAMWTRTLKLDAALPPTWAGPFADGSRRLPLQGVSVPRSASSSY